MSTFQIILATLIGISMVVIIYYNYPKPKKEKKHAPEDTKATSTETKESSHGGGHDHDHGHGSDSKKGISWLGVVIICLIIFFVVPLIWNYFSEINKGQPYKVLPPTGNTSNAVVFQAYTTPCEIIENGWFNVESDEPIGMKFPGVPKPVIYSGKGILNVPPGRLKGPVKFFDPKDEKNGNISFRIYSNN
jgi:hypothetical protein